MISITKVLEITGVKLLINNSSIPIAMRSYCGRLPDFLSADEIQVPIAHKAAPSKNNPKKFPQKTARSGT